MTGTADANPQQSNNLCKNYDIFIYYQISRLHCSVAIIYKESNPSIPVI